MTIRRCRYCRASLRLLLNLGSVPLANYFPDQQTYTRSKTYPLRLKQCISCGLLQVGHVVPAGKIFRDYHYMSSASAPLVDSLDAFATHAIKTYSLTAKHRVLDIGSNDGTLLVSFLTRGIGVFGVEPSDYLSSISRLRGVESYRAFFSDTTAKIIRQKYGTFDVICVMHVLANVVDPGDFFRGIKRLLAPNGVCIIEVADADEMLRLAQFDAVYHEHYSYFTLRTLTTIAHEQGFRVDRVQYTQNQGKSLRVTLRLDPTAQGRVALHSVSDSGMKAYTLEARVKKYKQKFLSYIKEAHGKRIAGLGAPAKSVTMVTYLGLTEHDISYIVDSTPLKQGRFLPGTHIPITSYQELRKRPPDVLILFCWNYAPFLLNQLHEYISAPMTIIVPFPTLRVMHYEN